MKEETEKWLEKAEEDFDTAVYMFKGKRYGYAAFWCQQAAEKAFKALQIEKTNKFDKIHDLVLLSQKVGAPQKITEFCKKLTIAYIYSRYPDAKSDKENMKELSEKFIEDSKEIIRWTKEKI